MSSTPATVQKPLVFAGEFRPTLDSKKRITVPARWRPEGKLEELFILKSTGRGCLIAMPLEELHATGERAAAQAPTTEAHQTFKDLFFAGATPCPIDGQGRMVLTDDLCRFAGIEKDTDLVLAGSGSKFDIWTSDAWQRQQEVGKPTFSTVMKGLGL